MVELQGKNAPYQVVARRFRPKAFQEVVGQDAILQSLKSALQQKRVPHAFVFAGSRGVGKTTTARILARCLNCANGPTPEPCGVCSLCRSILDGSNPDVVEIDAATHNGVDDIRQLRERVAFAPMLSRYKVYILDEVHMFSKGAFNAFLKTLEEPPPNVVFVLATTELHKLPETIRSRCQVLQFQRVGEDDITKRLQMIATADGLVLRTEVADEIAAQCRGGMRDAETALERALPLLRELGDQFDVAAYRQVVMRVGAERAVEVAAMLLQGEAAAALQFAAELQLAGVDEREALGELVEVLRSLLLLKIDGPDSLLVSARGQARQQLAALAALVEPHRLDAMIQAGVLGRERLRRLDDRGVVLELTLVRMAEASNLPTLADLLAEVRSGASAVLAARAPARVASGANAPIASLPRGTAAPVVKAPAVSEPRAAAVEPSPSGASELRVRLLARLAQERPLLQATVEHCRVDGPDANGRVVFTLQTERKLHRDRLASPQVQQQLEAMIRELTSANAAVEFQVGEANVSRADQPVSPMAPGNPRGEPGPTTLRVMGRFGGRVVSVNPDDRPQQVTPPASEPAKPDAPPVEDGGV